MKQVQLSRAIRWNNNLPNRKIHQMKQHQLLFVCLTFCSLLSSVALAAEKTVTGKVTAIDSVKNSITVGDVVLDVSRKTKITVYGEKSTLADIKPEHSAKVTYDDGLETAISIDVFKEVSEEETLAALKGTWIAVAEEVNGKRIKKEETKTKKKTLEIDGDKFTLAYSSVAKVVGTISVVSEDGPNAIDLKGKFVEGKGQSVLLRGIFEIRDARLRLCYSYNVDNKDRKRPTEFETEEGKDDHCITYELSDNHK